MPMADDAANPLYDPPRTVYQFIIPEGRFIIPEGLIIFFRLDRRQIDIIDRS
jgi:hypothetical protein